jgi:O-antigen/teichoic acid export membrane protein
MSKSGHIILKNASTLLVSQAVTWLLSLVLTIVLPRYLGATLSGQLGIAASIWALIGVLLSFGMDTYLVKEIARSPERAPDLLITSLVLRGGLFLIASVVVGIYTYLMQYPPEMVAIIFITGVGQLLWRFSAASEATLQGLETMQYISIATVIGKVVNTALGLGVVFFRLDIYAVAFIGVASALATHVVEMFFLMRRYPLRLTFAWQPAIAMLRCSAPYLLTALGLGIYRQVDVLVIGAVIDARAVGLYDAARQLFATTMTFGVVFITVIFPMLARTFAQQPDALPRIMRKSFDFVLLMSVPVGLGLLSIADPLVVLLFGPDFADSGPILAVLGLVTIFMYLNILIGKALVSMDRQRFWSMVMLVTAVVTIPLDLLLVPWCQQVFGNGALGGAISYLITEFGMVIVGICAMPRGTLGWPNIRVASRIIVIGMIMCAAAWWCRDLFIAIPIVVGAAVYITLILALRVIPQEDLQFLSKAGQTVLGRLRRRKVTAQPA